MQENTNTVESDVKIGEVTGATDTQPVAEKETKVQTNVEGSEDIDAKAQKIADSIVAKKLAKMPTKEELKSFKDWQDSQKTEEQKKTEEQEEVRKLKEENNNLKMEKAVLKSGVKEEDIDYVLFKLSKLDGEFDDNLTNFLKENPKYLSSNETAVTSTGVSTKRGEESKMDGVLSILKNKHPEIF